MPKLKRLSGKQVLAFCKLQGFELVRQKGSHCNILRVIGGRKQVVTIPNHREIDRGTLTGIYKQLARYVSDNELRVFFYTSDK
jgi:predicted RNA binding protein YcfA (HicA-like mRNA interferase family)